MDSVQIDELDWKMVEPKSDRMNQRFDRRIGQIGRLNRFLSPCTTLAPPPGAPPLAAITKTNQSYPTPSHLLITVSIQFVNWTGKWLNWWSDRWIGQIAWFSLNRTIQPISSSSRDPNSTFRHSTTNSNNNQSKLVLHSPLPNRGPSFTPGSPCRRWTFPNQSKLPLSPPLPVFASHPMVPAPPPWAL